ncbi:unnamed protein product [Schistocephalus solidus]|uniref:Complex1_LYR_dom domain-containing protein n=1 Tax=Schistocephalus solidus TaxID=70667 RepID=A0A183T3E8_SCHSO|nr:unnamed protein product [Schistocephalus solidus]
MAAQQRMAQLFKDLLRASNNFADYNFRSYFVRHVKATFEKSSSLTSKKEIESFIAEQEKNLEILEHYLKVSLEDVDDEFDGDSVVDLLLEYMPKRKIPERQEILETVLEAIKQDVDVDSQHQVTGILTSGESAETVARIPIQEDLTDLILRTLPSSHASRPSGNITSNYLVSVRLIMPLVKCTVYSASIAKLICHDELSAHLRATAGDVNATVDRLLTGDLITRDPSSPLLDDNRSNVNLPWMTPEERLATMERYGLVDASSSQTIHRPRIPTAVESQQESRIRYLNNQVVDTTGKRYIEIKQEYPNMPKPVYLKAGRKYRFH